MSITEVVQLCSGLSLDELARTLCEHWGWVTASGQAKVQACGKLLVKLEAEGELALPAMCHGGRAKLRRPCGTERTAPQPEITEPLAKVRPVTLEMVMDRQAKELWNEYVDRYHYLGFRRPFGCRVRYFVRSAGRPLGCVLMAGAAKSLGGAGCLDRLE